MFKERYINPFTDFGFKKIFGSEFSKELLIDFLNQVLSEQEEIEDLTYLNTENLGKSEEDRKVIFDLYCINKQGDRFIIELQNVHQSWFKDRSIYYATFPIQEQAIKGKGWNYQLNKVYTIGILNFSLPGTDERCKREIQLIDKETHEVFYDKLTFIYLEVPKFRKTEQELETQFDRWMFILKHLHHLQKRPVELQHRVFKKLFEIAEISKLTKEDMRAYEQSQKVMWDNYAVLETMKKEGIDIGIDRGKELVAINMIKEKADFDFIARITGLSLEKIEALAKNIE